MDFFKSLRKLFARKARPTSVQSKPRCRLFLEQLEDRSVPSVSVLAHDLQGNLYAAGNYDGARNFATGTTPSVLSSMGEADLFVAKYSASGDLLWAKSLAGSGGTNSQVNGIAVDAQGNVYFTGSMQGTIDFNPGPGSAQLFAAGSTDMFVAKLTGTGDFVWARHAGNDSAEEGNSIAIDNAGNVWAAGSFKKTVDFDPGTTSVALRTSRGDNDAVLWKLTADGAFAGAYQMGGAANDRGNDVAADDAGNVYLTGWFTESADFDPSSTNFTLNSAGSHDAFIAKLSNAGVLSWVRNVGGSFDEKGQEIAVDASGNVFAAGTFKGTVDFNPGQDAAKLTSAGDSDGYVLKLDAAGAFLWAQRFGGAAQDLVKGLAIDATSGNVLTAGTFQGTASFGNTSLSSAGAEDAFVTSLNRQGNIAWARRMGGAAAETSAGVVVDRQGNVYSAGSFTGSADFNPGNGGFVLDSSSNGANFLHKTTGAGIFVFAKAFGTIGTIGTPGPVGPIGDTVNAIRALGVTGFPTITTAGTTQTFTVSALDANGNILTGYRGTVNFSSSDQLAGLPASYTFTAADAGVRQFSATLKTVGTQSLTVTDAANSSIGGSQTGITVNTAITISSLAISAPSDVPGGVDFNVTVTVKNSAGAMASGYTGTVRFSSSDGAAVLPTNYTFTTADAGSRTFTVRLKTGGTQSLTVIDVANGALKATASGITVDVPSSSGETNAAPSTKFDLSHWKLTLPTGSSGKPTEIMPSTLNNGYSNAPYFFLDSDGAMVFWSPVNGVTTSGSSYPRTELRELLDPGDDNNNWNPGVGTHILAGSLKVTQQPSTGKVIIGQIHGFSGNAYPMVKLQSNNGTIEALVKLNPASSTDTKFFFANVGLGNLINYEIKASGGTLSLTVNGETQTADISKWNGQSAYFKAGAYAQDNSGPSTEGAKVSFYDLKVTHSNVSDNDSNPPPPPPPAPPPPDGQSNPNNPPSSPSTLNPNLPPSGNFDLSNWKITLPTGSSGSPTEIFPATLDDGYTNSPYFYTGADGAMVFFSPVTGVTTKNSTYPRSELRELLNPTSNATNWDPGSGTHILSASCMVTQEPSTGKTIIGQIHGYSGNAYPLIKLQMNNGAIVAQVKQDPASSNEVKVTMGNIGLNERINYEIKASGGTLTVTVNGVAKTFDISKWNGETCYFKAGAYCQDNEGPSTEGSRVAFYALDVTHT